MENNNTIIQVLKDSFTELQINSIGRVDFYTSISDEYDSLIHGVGIRDISYSKKLFIHGKESLNLLDRLSTNNITELNELEWERTIFTNNEGNIIDRTLLLRFEDYFLLLGSSCKKNKLLKWIDRFITSDDISAKDVSDDYSIFEVIGAESKAYMLLVLGDKQLELEENKIIRVQVENYFVHCVKYSDVGNVDKYVVVIESKYADNLCNYFLNNTSVFNLSFVGELAYNILRIEQGIPIVPNELNDKFNPCEANLEDELDVTKNGYIGCEPIKYIANNQNSGSKLSGIIFSEKLNDDNLNLTIHDSKSEQVGVITSVTTTYMLEHSIGIGYVDSDVEEKELKAINGTHEFKITLTDFPIIR